MVLVDVLAEALGATAAELGERALACTADVTSSVQLDAAVSAGVARFGGLDVAVANAGVEVLGAIDDADPVDFQRVIDVNLVGAWRTVRAALPEVARRRGYLLVVSSLAAVTSAPFNGAYNASKAGVVAIAKTLRVEARSRGVAVGLAYFSYIATETARRSVEDPRMVAVMKGAPKGLLRPIPVEVAAEAVVRGIERRASRVVVPHSQVLAIWFPELAQAILERFVRVPDRGS